MALLLRLRTTTTTMQNPPLLHHHRFSTSNSVDGDGNQPPFNFNSLPSSLFGEGELKDTFAASSSINSQQLRSIDKVLKKLSARSRTSVPPPLQQNKWQRRCGGGCDLDSGGSEPPRPRGGGLDMAAIRGSLWNQMESPCRGDQPPSNSRDFAEIETKLAELRSKISLPPHQSSVQKRGGKLKKTPQEKQTKQKKKTTGTATGS